MEDGHVETWRAAFLQKNGGKSRQKNAIFAGSFAKLTID
jgi:hypothetical protein